MAAWSIPTSRAASLRTAGSASSVVHRVARGAEAAVARIDGRPVEENLRTRFGLADGERALAAVIPPDDDGSGPRACATDWALYHRTGSGPILRMGWEQVLDLHLSAVTSILTIRRAELAEPVRLALSSVADTQPFLAAVRDRMAASTLSSQHVPMPGGTVTVLARRHPQSDRVVWHVVVPRGVDARPDGFRRDIQTAITELRIALGL